MYVSLLARLSDSWFVIHTDFVCFFGFFSAILMVAQHKFRVVITHQMRVLVTFGGVPSYAHSSFTVTLWGVERMVWTTFPFFIPDFAKFWRGEFFLFFIFFFWRQLFFV